MRDARPSAGHAPRGRGGVLATSRICKEFPERGRPGSLSPILWKEPARADGCGAMDSLLPSKNRRSDHGLHERLLGEAPLPD
jgi:hypothetical protein